MRFVNTLWALHPGMAADILRHMDEHAAEKAENSEKTVARPALAYAASGPVAVIAVNGPIDREAWFCATGQDEIRAALDAAIAAPDIKAVLLSINSPGGVVAGAKELAGHIAQCARQKPLAAYADGLCASAAYWLAAATGRIFAPVTAQVGSIGIIAVLTDWTKATERAGLVRTVLTSGRWKAAGSPDKALTDEERSLFQSQLEALHAIFKNDIEKFMRPQGADWAEGQTFLAADARERGLVSAIVADQTEALAKLAAIAAKKERKMDLSQLKAEYPDLLAEHEAEIKAACATDAEKTAAGARREVLDMARAAIGEEAAARVEKLLAAGATPEMLAAMKDIFPGMTARQAAPNAEAAPETAPDAEAEARARILAGLQAAHGGPLPAAPARQAQSPLVADAERRALEARQ